MIKNFFKIAWRSLLKNRSYFFINTFGLALALTVSFLMLLWVNDEWQMDKFHENDERLFSVKRTVPLEEGVLDVNNSASFPLLNAAQEQLPEVEKFLIVGRTFEDNLIVDNVSYRAPGTFTNADYFSGFSFPVLQGDIDQLDKRPEAIAISKSLAQRIWGLDWSTKAIGKPIEILDNATFTVAAIYEDFPSSSSIQNDFYYSFQKVLNENERLLDWNINRIQGVLLLNDNANPNLVSTKLNTLLQENIEGTNKEGCFLQKYSDAYLYGSFDEKAMVKGGRIDYVRIFTIAAIFLLIVSCVNFVNLSTVHATKRSGEIGVKKVVGARKNTLIVQFLTETSIITLIAFMLALGITMFVLPEISDFVGKALKIDFGNPVFWMIIIGLFVFTVLFSGVYPALVISSFNPVEALKGKANEKKATISLRKGLVVLQFGLTVLLMVSALIVKQQVKYINEKDLGIVRDHIVSIHQDAALTKKYETLRNELIASNSIEDVTLVGPSPLDINASSSGVVWPKKEVAQENIEFSLLWTAYNFPKVFDVPTVSGNYYREGSLDTLNIVLNEKAIEIMGMKDPIGKTIQIWGQQRTIMGVLKDFHNRSLYEDIQPTIFFLDPNDAGEMFVKLKGENIKDGLATLQSAFQKVLPDIPLNYEFLDKAYEAQYQSEILTGKLTFYFALISILISCLGLFGLASFMAKQRTKEIGIRKVLGATVENITALISKDFLKLVFIAILIAFPIAYYIMAGWLNDFTYKIDIAWWVFALVGVLTAAIALTTISFQTIKAALANPIKALRTE